MLSKTDIKNIENFDRLSASHRRIFRHRLKKKMNGVFKDLLYLLLVYQSIGLKQREVIDVRTLQDIVRLLLTLQIEKYGKMFRGGVTKSVYK